MDIGFDTIGNATLIVHDHGPLLITDPWVAGDCYFGSWTMSHEIPEEQRQEIAQAPFAWLSHGHPDHLHFDSLAAMKDKTFLLPDHVGGRIHGFLVEEGFATHVLRDREWFSLSDRVRVMSVADHNQDAILLCDVGGVLVANINDSGIVGSKSYVRKLIRSFPVSIGLFGAPGDVDMINYWDESGQRILPPPHDDRLSGRMVAQRATDLGVRYCIPFSAMHRYQREDSMWASSFTTAPAEYALGFESKHAELLDPFSRVSLAGTLSVQSLDPPPTPLIIRAPEDFGDRWNETLDPEGLAAADAYFRSISHLASVYDFINLRVGGEDNFIVLRQKRQGSVKRDVGITFEAPRCSLTKAIQYEVFDDLLIGNFMKTTIHGSRGLTTLSPHFAPYVGKYADNGRARSESELQAYFSEYKQRDPVGHLRDRLTIKSAQVVRSYLPRDSMAYRSARSVYRHARRLI